jgi:hypothetical protein
VGLVVIIVRLFVIIVRQDAVCTVFADYCVDEGEKADRSVAR